MEVSNEIMEAVKKSLPEQTVGILRKELEELARLRGIETRYQTAANKLSDTEQELSVLSIKLDEFTKREQNLIQRERKVQDDERNLKVQILEVKLEEANKRSDIGKELASVVFRNKTYIESVIKNFPNGTYPVFSPDGKSVTAPVSSGETRTIKEE